MPPRLDSGTNRRPNSAIEGTVCNRFSTAKIGPCQCGRRTAAIASGNPIATAGPTAAATSTIAAPAPPRTPAARLVLLGERQRVEHAPARHQGEADRIPTAAASRGVPASARCNPSTTASARRGEDPEPGAKRDPRQARRSRGEHCRRLPEAASTANSSAAASAAPSDAAPVAAAQTPPRGEPGLKRPQPWCGPGRRRQKGQSAAPITGGSAPR